MINPDNQLLNLCFEDSLFAALYPALLHLHQKWESSAPVALWLKALDTKESLHGSRRPDLLLATLFVDMPLPDALLTQALLLWMLMVEDGDKPSPVKDNLCRRLAAHDEEWRTIYEWFSKSEADNESMGYQIEPHLIARQPTSGFAEQPHRSNSDLHDFIVTAISTASTEVCRNITLVLSRLNIDKGHVYEEEEKMLLDKMSEWNRMEHKRKPVINNFGKDSCHVQGDLVGNKDVQYEVNGVGVGGVGVATFPP